MGEYALYEVIDEEQYRYHLKHSFSIPAGCLSAEPVSTHEKYMHAVWERMRLRDDTGKQYAVKPIR